MANAMRRVAVRNLRAHKIRLALTVISVMLGTAFIAGSFVFTDTLKSTFDKVFASADRGVDVQVTAKKATDLGVPVQLIETLRQVPGVRRVQLDASGPLVLIAKNGKPVRTGGPPSEGGVWHDPADSVRPVPTFASGRAPTATGEIALNVGAARKAGLSAGDRTKVVVASRGLIDVTISGIYRTDVQTGGYVGALFTADQARALFTDGTHVDSVSIAGDGTAEQTLRDRIAKTLPSNLQAKTGTQVRAETRTAVAKALSFVNYFLLAFGFIALIVGTFIIYNTFSMIVAQRVRELALLRAVGADRGQVRRSVLFEAGVIGLVGSALGVAAGVALAIGLRALLDAVGVGLPSGPLDIRPRTVIVGLVVGVVVTVLSANAPSRRAARTPPVAAMRAEFAALGMSLKRRSIAGVVATVIGAIVAVIGTRETDAATAAILVAVALVIVGAAVMLLAPLLARVLIGALGVLGRPFGAIGRLARTNATRNPRRTAATAFALTVGLMLVAGVAVLGDSAKRTINRAVDKGVSADLVLTGIDNGLVPLSAADIARRTAGVGTLVELAPVLTTTGGAGVFGIGVDGPLAEVAPLRMISGARTVDAQTMIVSKQYAADHRWRLGQTIRLTQPGGATVTLRVGGIYADQGLFTSWIVTGDVGRQLTPAQRRVDLVVLVNAATGTNRADLQRRLQAATDPLYIVEVQDKEQFKGEQARQIDGLLNIVYALLALAIVIAILGIVNTLALSVVERRREIGMLRAVGMVRGQLRRTIYLESLLIAVYGAVLGVALGVGFGVLFAHALRTKGLSDISVPAGQVIAYVVVAAVVGVLAALWPAGRAARIRPLAVIAEP